MEQNIKYLSKRLNVLGYRDYEIKTIIKEAIGHVELDLNNHRQCAKTVIALKKYEALGKHYLHFYSK